jgi:hypothetical protein
MVKNLGGNKSKRYARKDVAKKDGSLRLIEEEGELYAQVTKIYGGTSCQVVTLDCTEMLCHIRGKFSRPRGKRDNFIGNGVWVLVGKREWEKDDIKGIKISNCDLLEVYNEKEKILLKNNVTNVNWSTFINYDYKMLGNANVTNNAENGFEFGDEKQQEYQELLNAQIATNSVIGDEGTSNIINDDGELIDVDDI